MISNLPILPDLTKYSDNGTLFDEFENLSVLNKKYEEITDYLKNRISKIDKTDSLDTIPVVTSKVYSALLFLRAVYFPQDCQSHQNDMDFLLIYMVFLSYNQSFGDK
ncbi:MAG: hypothetical protein Ct9H90mP13_00990 [Pseudomonadota bacterium]|nr:MAG: hypothetical protein Ct9H90mP13_00990 [Pseudomonadota bacterium]